MPSPVPRAVPASALPIIMPASVKAACRIAAGGREGYFALDTRARRVAAHCVFTCRFAQSGAQSGTQSGALRGGDMATWVGGANLPARRLDLEAAGIEAPAGTLFLRVTSAVAACRSAPVPRHRRHRTIHRRHRRHRHRSR